MAAISAVLTGGHCASLSAATIWTFKCLAWDFPLDFINLCKTWDNIARNKQRERGRERGREGERNSMSEWEHSQQRPFNQTPHCCFHCYNYSLLAGFNRSDWHVLAPYCKKNIVGATCVLLQNEASGSLITNPKDYSAESLPMHPVTTVTWITLQTLLT